MADQVVIERWLPFVVAHLVDEFQDQRGGPSRLRLYDNRARGEFAAGVRDAERLVAPVWKTRTVEQRHDQQHAVAVGDTPGRFTVTLHVAVQTVETDQQRPFVVMRGFVEIDFDGRAADIDDALACPGGKRLLAVRRQRTGREADTAEGLEQGAARCAETHIS